MAAEYNEYNITFLYGFMEPDGGASFSFDADTPRKLILTKEQAFDRASGDMTPVVVKDGKLKPKRDADRAYLHYIIDCWLDDKPVAVHPSELG